MLDFFALVFIYHHFYTILVIGVTIVSILLVLGLLCLPLLIITGIVNAIMGDGDV